MPKLKPGSMIIDLVDGSIHGDLDHCPKEDLLESARALLSLLRQVQHKGLWGLSKDYDAGCYIHTSAKRYKCPEVSLEIGFQTHRHFSIMTLNDDWETRWKNDWWSKPVGKIEGGEVVDSIEGVTDHYVPRPAPTVPAPRGKTSAGKPEPIVEQPRLI